MFKKSLNILFAFALFFACTSFVCTQAFAQNSFVVNAPRVVSQGETFSIEFTADGEISDFQRPSVSGASILAGPTPSKSSYTQIINGRRSSSYSETYTYILQAGNEGKVSVSSASATIGSRTYRTRAISVDIVKGQSSSGSRQSSGGNYSGSRQSASDDDYSEPVSSGSSEVFLRLSLNKKNVVKGEPIIATLKIYSRASITGFEDIKFPVFNGFWSQEIETPQNINFSRERVGSKIYESAVLRKYVLLPQQTGKLTIDPAELVCQVQVASKPRKSRSFFDDFFDSDTYSLVKKKVTTGRQTIYVSPLPGGAPASYGGGVGKFSMNVKLTRDSVKSNEAASLIVEIAGSGNLNLIEAPKVTLPSDFEKYDMKTTNSFSNGASGTSGKKIFEFPFIPRSEGEFEIPAISYSYYDINSKRYVTLSADAIKFKVTKGDPNAASAYVSGVDQQQVNNIGQDVRYINNGNPKLVQKGKFLINGWIFYVILIAVIAALYGIYRYLKNRIAINGDIIRSRNKRANKVAKNRLRMAQSFLAQNKVPEFYEELHKALLGYISDKLSIQFADMQRDTIEETLKEKNVGDESIESFMKLLDDCEMVRYSPEGAGGAMDSQYNKGVEIISSLEDKLK